MFTRHYPESKSEVVYASRLMKVKDLRKALAADRNQKQVRKGA